MSSNLTTLETYVHIFSLNKIKILSFILLALKSGLAKKRINFYFSNCVCVCPAELLTFSAEVISFWKEFLEGNRVPLRLSSLNLLASFPIFTVLHHPSYPFWSFNFSLSLSRFFRLSLRILSFRSSFFSAPHSRLSIILFQSTGLEVGRNRTNTYTSYPDRSNLNF